MLLQRIYRYYLLFVFGLCYLISYIPVWYVLIVRKNYRQGQMLRRTCVRCICFLSGISYEVLGDKDIDFSKTYIICSNHDSFLDIPAMLLAVPGYFGFMGKSEIGENSFAKMFFKTIDISVDRRDSHRSAASYKKAVTALREGRSLVIFPEGGIFHEQDKMSLFKDGAFQLAVRQQVEVLPISMPDNWKIFPDEKKIAKPGKIRLILHKPVSSSVDAETLKQQVYDIIQEDLTRHKR